MASAAATLVSEIALARLGKTADDRQSRRALEALPG